MAKALQTRSLSYVTTCWKLPIQQHVLSIQAVHMRLCLISESDIPCLMARISLISSITEWAGSGISSSSITISGSDDISDATAFSGDVNQLRSAPDALFS